MLNRVIKWHKDGITYEADKKHVPEMLKAMNLEHAKSLSNPGIKQDDSLEGEVDLEGDAATKYRAVVAKCNYLAADRPDVQYPTKECCRRMASPRVSDWDLIKHLLRYLIGRRRAVQWFRWQPRGRSKNLIGYSDSDWAGCRESRKSTSGGCIMWIKSWSKTQPIVATSSGEAELYAASKCGSELIGIRSIAKDLGMEFNISMSDDANSTLGMLHRRGLGKLRHVDVTKLWLQDVVKQKGLEVKKIPGSENPADMMTKYLPNQTISSYMDFLAFEFV